MRLLKYELRKVLTKKLFLGFLAAALAVNFAVLWWVNRPEGFTHAETRAMFDELRPLDYEGKLAVLERERALLDAYEAKAQLSFAIENGLTDDEYLAELQAASQAAEQTYSDRIAIPRSLEAVRGQRELVDAVVRDLTVKNHPALLDAIDDAADRQLNSAIFGSDSDTFLARNIVKTQRDYAGMRDTPIRYDGGGGLELLFSSPSTDIVLLFLIVIVCLFLITDEKDKRLFLLIKATPGGASRTIAAKLGTLTLVLGGIHHLIFAGNVAVAEATWGLGYLFRSIQSVPALMASTLPLNVLQFIGLFFFVKTAGLIAAGMAVMLTAVLVRHTILLPALAAASAIGSVALCAIPAGSGWNWLKYLNPAAFMAPYEVLRGYINLNFLGYPVGLFPVFALFCVFAVGGLIAANVVCFIRLRGLESRRVSLSLSHFAGGDSLRVHGGLVRYEWKKLAGAGRVVVILVAFALLQGWLMYTAEKPQPMYGHGYYKQTLLFLEGPLTSEKEAFIRNEKARYDEAQAAVAQRPESEPGEEYLRQQMILEKMALFPEIYARYEYIKQNPEIPFLYDTGYARLLGLSTDSEGLMSGIKLTAMLALCLCGVFALEYKTGMVRVIGATACGRTDIVKRKLLLSGIEALIVYIVTYVPDIIFMARFYGFPGLSLPLAGIPAGERGSLPSTFDGIPVWGYIALLFGLRLVVCLGIALIVLALSLAIGNNVYAALSAWGLLLTPLLLRLMGIRLLDAASLYPLLSAGGLFVYLPVWISIVTFLVFIVIVTACGVFVARRFGMVNPLALPV